MNNETTLHTGYENLADEELLAEFGRLRTKTKTDFRGWSLLKFAEVKRELGKRNIEQPLA